MRATGLTIHGMEDHGTKSAWKEIARDDQPSAVQRCPMAGAIGTAGRRRADARPRHCRSIAIQAAADAVGVRSWVPVDPEILRRVRSALDRL